MQPRRISPNFPHADVNVNDGENIDPRLRSDVSAATQPPTDLSDQAVTQPHPSSESAWSSAIGRNGFVRVDAAVYSAVRDDGASAPLGAPHTEGGTALDSVQPDNTSRPGLPGWESTSHLPESSFHTDLLDIIRDRQGSEGIPTSTSASRFSATPGSRHNFRVYRPARTHRTAAGRFNPNRLLQRYLNRSIFGSNNPYNALFDNIPGSGIGNDTALSIVPRSGELYSPRFLPPNKERDLSDFLKNVSVARSVLYTEADSVLEVIAKEVPTADDDDEELMTTKKTAFIEAYEHLQDVSRSATADSIRTVRSVANGDIVVDRPSSRSRCPSLRKDCEEFLDRSHRDRGRIIQSSAEDFLSMSITDPYELIMGSD
ncbi:hypothetical protein I316_01838 [Kwoniella heveanensis BCC8398]|uniref:Uncharacterized protein n=1 Tax=Kwoniella heveanensis BCC8398 TaxID=1296120 RepID=A0A1B9H008_9TREE|nr:hypothetical protein I316_01838 [Kwoniella heveanensis BCC8398]